MIGAAQATTEDRIHEPGPVDPFRSGARAVRLLTASLRHDARVAWRHVWLGILAGSPLAPRVLRYLLYRAFGLDVRTANVWPRCTIVGSRLSIGRGTFINQRCFIEAVGPVRIGEGCQVGMEVMILTSHHEVGSTGASATATYRGVEIGDRVWLGARVTVLPGVRIAANSVVAAGAVVAKDLDRSGVYAGVPAKKVRDL